MAQTGSAQREPSMEEILASIRRIIEDSDAVRPPLDEVPPVMAASARVIETIEPVAEDDVAAFRAELDEIVEPQPIAVPEVEIQARKPAPVVDYTHEEIEIEEPVAMAPEPVAEFEPEVDASASAPEMVEEQAEPRVSSLPIAPMERVERADLATRPSLVSDTTGRQVAAAFGELSEAFAASRRRSFDEMAEEMLRPMLQDWLDNNLPTLVERLVREEIERVARGGQQ